MSITSMHNDYLDPDRHLNHPYNDDNDWPELTTEQVTEIKHIRAELHRLRSECYAAERAKITVDMLFCWNEGAFACEGEPEDVGVPWISDEGEWLESVQYTEYGRDEDGKRWYIVREDSIAGCGDYQPIAGWDEREGDEATEDVLDGVWHCILGRWVEFEFGWGIYALDLAETGSDPLEKWYRQPTVEDAINQAKKHIESLTKVMGAIVHGK